jgi:hypothetical protein
VQKRDRLFHRGENANLPRRQRPTQHTPTPTPPTLRTRRTRGWTRPDERVERWRRNDCGYAGSRQRTSDSLSSWIPILR